jgi:hypothetical protein
MKTKLGVVVGCMLLMIASTAFADIVMYREIFPMGSSTVATQRALDQGWIGYRSSNMLLGPAFDSLQISTPSAGGYGDADQINSVPVGCLLSQSTQGDGRAFISIHTVGNCAMFTSEYSFAFANATRVEWDDQSSNTVNRRVLMHIQGEDPALWWVTDATFTRPKDATLVHAVFNLAQTTWKQVGLYDGGNQSTDFTGVTAGTLSGTVDSFGIWEDNPASGNRRFDNYTVFGVPEPMTMTLLGLGVVGLIRRR